MAAIKHYSIADARHNLAALVHECEEDGPIQLTRRGEPVAVLLSQADYARLTEPRRDFWEAYLAFRTEADQEALAGASDPFVGTRDMAPGREVAL